MYSVNFHISKYKLFNQGTMLESNIQIFNNIGIIELTGHFELSTVNHIERCFRKLILERYPVVAFNLKKLSYIDSSGIGSFIRCVNLGLKEGSKTVFFGANENIKTVFRLSKLDTFITIVSEEEFQNGFCKQDSIGA